MTENTTTVKEAEEVKDDPVEILEPEAKEFQITIGKDEYEYTFIQKPLSFFGKMDFFSVMGTALEKALSGPGATSLSDLWNSPVTDRTQSLQAHDFKDADAFIVGISRLARYAPEILQDLFCVFLSVPRGQRPTVKEIMALPEDEGGIKDADAINVIETAVDQNWDVMVDFFGEQVKPLMDKMGGKLGRGSQSSKPSRSTRRATQKRSKT